MSQAFSRNAIGGLEPLVAEVIDGYLDALSDRNEFDLVAEFAALFPVEVISTILGVPEGERQQVRLWVDMFLHREEGNPNTTHDGIEAALHMAGYFLDLARAKRREPDGLLISKLIEATLRDDDGREQRLSEDVAEFSVLIAGAGERDCDQTHRKWRGPLRPASRPVGARAGRQRTNSSRRRGDTTDASTFSVPGSFCDSSGGVRRGHDSRRFSRDSAHRRGNA